MATLSRPGIVQNNLIDLTLLDDTGEDESLTPLFSDLARTSNAVAHNFPPASTSHDGLIFDNAFTNSMNGSFSKTPTSSTGFVKAPPILPDRGRKRPRSPVPNSLPSYEKRQRIDSNTSGHDLGQTLFIKTSGNGRNSEQKATVPEIAKSRSQDSNTAQILEQNSSITSVEYSDEIKRILKSICLDQILPHINQCLLRHEVPEKTSNQVKKKVLAELCEDALRIISASGHDRLSKESEHKFAIKAVRLVGQYMKERILPTNAMVSSLANDVRLVASGENQDASVQHLEKTVDQRHVPHRKSSDGKIVIDLSLSEDEVDDGKYSGTSKHLVQRQASQEQVKSKMSEHDVQETKQNIIDGEHHQRSISSETIVIDPDTQEDEKNVRDTQKSSVQKAPDRPDKSHIPSSTTVYNGGSSIGNNAQEAEEVRITGPPSSFILYRKDKVKIVARQYPGLRNWELSPIISAMWAKERPQVKERYKACADEIKRKILEKYPGWKPFRRKRNLDPDTKQPVTKASHIVAPPAVASLVVVKSKPDVDDAEPDIPSSPSSRSSPAPRTRVRRSRHLDQTLPFSSGSTEDRARQNLPRLRETALERSRRLVENLQLSGLHPSLPRPYLSHQARADIARGLSLAKSQQHSVLTNAEILPLDGAVFHVDFSSAELQGVAEAIIAIRAAAPPPKSTYTKFDIEDLMSRSSNDIASILKVLKRSNVLSGRSQSDIAEFLKDAVEKQISKQPGIRRIQAVNQKTFTEAVEEAQLESILLSREIWGPNYRGRNRQPAHANLGKLFEDTMYREAEWTDCSGDIATVTWIPGGRFICGAITHSDAHNQQYNKPGNLLVGSVRTKSLVSVSGHKIPRPIIHEGQNSLESMRSTQDPWLYCSVSSTAYDPINKKCFTASYDQTVKIWDCDPDGSILTHCGSWAHAGNVNFVVTSPNHDLVATAADVSRDAVRVYHFDEADASASRYNSYSGARADELVSQQNDGMTPKWGYFPATVSWGKSPSVAHLLLVGYSPRSPQCEDWEIPEDKANTGELCLWNVYDGSSIQIASARTANVFEVVWHPTLPMFFASTSASGEHDEGVRTQIRVFSQTEVGTFIHTKTLDCPALDINEITVRPNSFLHSYVTASCTDGNTYVFDTAQGDKPVHVLCHGESIDDSVRGISREECDSGVKFSAWGKTLDRFYTGSSDGVVKAWNVRASAGQAFLHNVISLSGGISTGAFSPDFSKLLVGDATGKVHLLSAEGQELGDSENFIRQPITPHAEPERPTMANNVEPAGEPTARESARRFLESGQIDIHPDRYIGAVQGPNYAESGLFCNEDNDLIAQWTERQESRYQKDAICFPRLAEDIMSSSQTAHERNQNLDLDLATIDSETLAELQAECGSLNGDASAEFDFEAPIGDIFVDSMNDSASSDQTSQLLRQSDLETTDCLLSNTEIQEMIDLQGKIKVELEIQRSLKVVQDELYHG